MSSGIYCIKNRVNNKLYIGSAIDFKNRFKWHKKDLRRNVHHSIRLQNAWNKYGEENFIFEILDTVDNLEELVPIEQAYLDFFNSSDRKYGYNICKFAGSSLGVVRSTQTKRKISESMKGIIPWNKGKERSEETKRKISKSLKGFKHSKETKQKMSDSHRGKKKSIKERLKIQGKNNPFYGKKHSKETKLKISRKNKGLLVGENNPATSLNNFQVRVIKRLLKDGRIKQCEIAKIFGVNPPVISDIKIGKTWKHIQNMETL